MKKLMKSEVCGTREQCTDILFTTEKSKHATRKKKKRKETQTILSVLLILFNRISKHDSKDVKFIHITKKENVKVFGNYKRVQNFHLERAFPVNLCVKQRLGSNRIGLVGHAISPVAS